MPLLAKIINPYLWTGVVEDPNPKRNRVYVNNLAYDKDTLEPIAIAELGGVQGFYFQPTTESMGVSDGIDWSDWPVILTTDKCGISWSDSRQTWPARIGSWDPWLLFLNYNDVKSKAFYNPLSEHTSIYWPRDLTANNMRQDVWAGRDLAWTTSYRTTTQNNYVIPAILREDNQWLALDQNYLGTTIVWLALNGSEPVITQQITYNDNIQHFVLGNDNLGRSWFVEVHGNTHAYSFKIIGMTNSADNVQIPSTILSGITGGYTGVINQFPSNFIPNNTDRKVFYSSHYNSTATTLEPRRFVWDKAAGTIDVSVCTLTYPNVGDTYGTYAQVCTSNNFNTAGVNSWFIKPHVFTKNNRNFITFCTVEKSHAYYRSERWAANTKQRAWLTYEISPTNDNTLIYHSSITWPYVDNMARMFLPINPDGNKMLVFQTGRYVELIFNPIQGWYINKTISLDVRGYGIDSTGRVYLATRSGAVPNTAGGTANGTVMDGYNSIYTHDSSLPLNVSIRFSSPSGYEYNGTPINTDCIVKTSDSSPLRIQGDTHTSNFSPFASGGYSVRTSFAAATAGRISGYNSEDFDFGTNNFCIEFWMFNNIAFSSQTNLCGIVGHKFGDAYFGWQILRNGDSKMCLRLSYGTPGVATSTFDFKSVSDIPQDNLWHHWALVRHNNSVKWYLDGVLNSSTPSTHDIFDNYAQLWIGWSQTSGAYYSGWISNLRIVKGNPVYVDNFTVPTSPLTVTQSAGTNILAIATGECKLLTCNAPDIVNSAALTNNRLKLKINGTSATFADGSTSKNVNTINGEVTVPIIITGNSYTSIDCYGILPITWETTAGNLTNAAKNEAYSYQLVVAGSDGATYSIVSGSLPTGLTINSSTGLISGTPTVNSPTTFSFTVRVVNSTEIIERDFNIYCSLERPTITSLTYPQEASNIYVANTTGGETITVTGTNFRTGAIVNINGAPQTTTFISATQLTFVTPANLSSNTYSLTVYNADNVTSTGYNIPFSIVPSFTTSQTLAPILENISSEISIVYNSDSQITWTVVTSNLPGTLAFNTSTSKITGNPGVIPTNTANYNITLRITDQQNQIVERTFTLPIYKAGAAGQQSWTIPGTYSWVCPANVTSICAVAVGAGASGGTNTGGGGGGLGWKNSIAVTPGQTYAVVVGAGGTGGSSGGNSYFNTIQTIAGYGGTGGNTTGVGGAFTGDGGGNGGNGGSGEGAGGGGAAGYTGNGGYGGAGGYVSNTITQSGGTATGGGGGGGSGAFNAYNATTGRSSGGGGGGVGLLGQTSNGIGAVSVYETQWGGVGHGGGGGSSGANGGEGSGNFAWQDQDPGGYGGAYGGGAGKPSNSAVSNGAGGAVRIIWGPNRSFPNTNTSDQSV